LGYNLRATRDESPALCIVVSFSLQSSDFSCWFSERALRWKGFPDRDNLCVAVGIASLNHRKGMNVRDVSGRNHQSCSVMIPYRETMTGGCYPWVSLRSTHGYLLIFPTENLGGVRRSPFRATLQLRAPSPLTAEN